MVRIRLALALAIVLGLVSLYGPNRGPGDTVGDADAAHRASGNRSGPRAAYLHQAATPAATPGLGSDSGAATPIPQVTPVSGDVAGDQDRRGEIVPADSTGDANEDPPGVIAPVSAQDEGVPAGGPPSRLRERVPGSLVLWIILPGESFTVGADGTCVGAGEFAGMRPGGVVSLLDQEAAAAHIESVMIEAAGRPFFDTVLQQDVCAFDLAFTRVVPGTRVLVDLDRVVLGGFAHTAPPSGDGGPAVYDIVAGQ